MYASPGLITVKTVAEYEAAVAGLPVNIYMQKKAFYETHPPPYLEPVVREKGHGRSEISKLGCKPKSPRPQPKRKEPTAAEGLEITRGWQVRLQERKFAVQRDANARVATYNRARREIMQKGEKYKPANVGTNNAPRPEHESAIRDVQKTARSLLQTKRRLGRASLALTKGTPGNHEWVSNAIADKEFERADQAALKVTRKVDNPFHN